MAAARRRRRRSGELRALAGYARRLRGSLNRPLTAEACRERIAAALRTREQRFLTLLEGSVFASAASPYRALLRRAGAELGDVARLVAGLGLEGALSALCDEGVFLTLEEFKGRRPIVRPGLELAVRPADLASPARAAVVARTGGSRGAGTPLLFDLDHLRDDGLYHLLGDEACGGSGRPLALWRPAPPGFAGLYQALSRAGVGRRVERWFSQNGMPLLPRPQRGVATLLYTIAASRGTATPIPYPERVPLDEALRVARWLERRRRERHPAYLNTTASCGVRVATAAREAGLDLAGALFELTGEPVTEAKARAVREAGVSDLTTGYFMSEIGRIGVGCGAPAAVDDVHVATDKLAVVQRERPLEDGGRRVRALLYTTLSASAPRLLLNVESDDYGVLERRDCGCPVGAAGLTLHLHRIRSFEKLASEGMSFLGSELLRLVEEVLPARFGGSPGDYQLVEEEVGGLPRVAIVVSPRVGPLDEAEIVDCALRALGARSPASRLMADVWRRGGTLRVVRREPYATSAAKVLPLHVLEPT